MGYGEGKKFFKNIYTKFRRTKHQIKLYNEETENVITLDCCSNINVASPAVYGACCVNMKV